MLNKSNISVYKERNKRQRNAICI